MTPRGEGLRAERTRAVLRFAVLALVLAAPLPFGSVEPGAVLALELSCAVVGALAVLVLLREPHAWPRAASPALAAVAVWVLVGVLQLLPVPSGWSAPPAAEARHALAPLVPEIAAATASWSVSPPDTVDATVRLCAYVLLGLAAAVAFDRRRYARTAAIVIASSAAFQALYGAAEYLSGRQHIFGYAKQHYLDEATGTFINRNHFAGYLAMALPLALALALPAQREGANGNGWRKRTLAWAGASGVGTVLAFVAVASIWAGIALSYSRTGLAAAALASACFLFTAGLARKTLVTALLLSAIPIVLLMGLEIRAPAERFATVLAEAESGRGRAVVWRTTAGLAARHPILGHGLGTFETVYEPHRSPRAPGRYDHAHNDWLESFCDGGVLALGAGLVLLVISARWLRRLPEEILLGSGVVRVAAGAGVMAIAAHSLTDFCLRIPANAALLAVLLGLQASREVTVGSPVTRFRLPNSQSRVGGESVAASSSRRRGGLRDDSP